MNVPTQIRYTVDFCWNPLSWSNKGISMIFSGIFQIRRWFGFGCSVSTSCSPPSPEAMEAMETMEAMERYLEILLVSPQKQTHIPVNKIWFVTSLTYFLRLQVWNISKNFEALQKMEERWLEDVPRPVCEGQEMWLLQVEGQAALVTFCWILCVYQGKQCFLLTVIWKKSKGSAWVSGQKYCGLHTHVGCVFLWFGYKFLLFY